MVSSTARISPSLRPKVCAIFSTKESGGWSATKRTVSLREIKRDIQHLEAIGHAAACRDFHAQDDLSPMIVQPLYELKAATLAWIAQGPAGETARTSVTSR